MKGRGIDHGQVVDADPCRVDRGMGASGRQLGRNKVQSHSIRAGREVDNGLEMRRIDGPGDRWEALLVMVDGDTSVQRM